MWVLLACPLQCLLFYNYSETLNWKLSLYNTISNRSMSESFSVCSILFHSFVIIPLILFSPCYCEC